MATSVAVPAPTFAENLAAKREALRGEKIAAELERTTSPADGLTHADKKDFLITDLKSVNSASALVGTRVAKEMAPMIFTLTHRAKTAAAELAVGAFTPSLPSTSAFTTSVDVLAPVATVPATLAAVATAIESLSSARAELLRGLIFNFRSGVTNSACAWNGARVPCTLSFARILRSCARRLRTNGSPRFPWSSAANSTWPRRSSVRPPIALQILAHSIRVTRRIAPRRHLLVLPR